MGRNINFYMVNDKIDGIIKCSSYDMSVIAYKLPRDLISEDLNIQELQYAGIYLLLNSKSLECYIGQANNRNLTNKNKKGLLKRVMEHKYDIHREMWDTAIIFTTNGNVLGATDITWLESTIVEFIKNENKLTLKNISTPNKGNITIEKESELVRILDQIVIYIQILIYNINIKNAHNTIDNIDIEELVQFILDNNYENSIYKAEFNGNKAIGIRLKNNKIALLRGSLLARKSDGLEDTVNNTINNYKNFGYYGDNSILLKTLIVDMKDANILLLGKSNLEYYWKNISIEELASIYENKNGFCN